MILAHPNHYGSASFFDSLIIQLNLKKDYISLHLIGD